MASRNFPSQRLFSNHFQLVQLDCQVTIGASGAPTLVTSSTVPTSSPAASQAESRGIKAITRLAAGIYKLQLSDNYSDLYDFKASFTSAVTGSAIAVDATTAGLSVGTAYQIVTVGTATTAANYTTLGLPAGLTATVGQIFVALTTGTGTQSGAGTVKALTDQTTGMQAEVCGVPTTMLSYQPFQASDGGGYIIFKTMGPSFAGTFTGSALGTHTHAIAVATGTAGDAVTNNAGVLNSTGGQDLVTEATSGGTPAGTIAGTITSAAADPTNGCTMYIKILLSNSSIQ